MATVVLFRSHIRRHPLELKGGLVPSLWSGFIIFLSSTVKAQFADLSLVERTCSTHQDIRILILNLEWLVSCFLSFLILVLSISSFLIGIWKLICFQLAPQKPIWLYPSSSQLWSFLSNLAGQILFISCICVE